MNKHIVKHIVTGRNLPTLIKSFALDKYEEAHPPLSVWMPVKVVLSTLQFLKSANFTGCRWIEPNPNFPEGFALYTAPARDSM